MIPCLGTLLKFLSKKFVKKVEAVVIEDHHLRISVLAHELGICEG
jgi:hypothetical protein